MNAMGPVTWMWRNVSKEPFCRTFSQSSFISLLKSAVLHYEKRRINYKITWYLLLSTWTFTRTEH